MGVTPRVAVLIVDDEALMRAGIRLMIDGVDGIEVVGEASDGRAAIEAVQRLDPDVVLMDIRMPGMSGIDATRALVAAGTRARIVVLTAFDTDAFLVDALRAGALSFLLKDAAPDLVLGAVQDAAEGRSRVSPGALTRLMSLATREPEQHGAPTPPAGEALRMAGGSVARPPSVTEREWEVGRFVAQGLTNAEIAAALYLSGATVKTHLASLFAKLHVSNRVQLAILVLEHEHRP